MDIPWKRIFELVKLDICMVVYFRGRVDFAQNYFTKDWSEESCMSEMLIIILAWM